MNHKTELQKLALGINELLSEYIFLHDTLQRKSNSFLSIFKPINFNELHHKAEEILFKLKDRLLEISKLKKDIKINSEKQFVDCLLEYTQALITTVELYREMVNSLLSKSRGGKLSLRERMTNSKIYEESINNYVNLGQKLNELYKEL